MEKVILISMVSTLLSTRFIGNNDISQRKKVTV